MTQDQHYHLLTRSIDGVEFSNCLYENHIDAALAFCAIAQDITKYDPRPLTIERVVNSLDTDGTNNSGLWVGQKGLIMLVHRCQGGCFSPSWN